METTDQEARKVSFELLKKYGMRWAVLTAMGLDLVKYGIRLSPAVHEQLKLARMQIMSGCFSPCEVGCVLGQIEGQLVAAAASVGEDYVRQWFDLLGRAMQGLLDLHRVADIPALQPVATDCQFLACHCGAPAAPLRP